MPVRIIPVNFFDQVASANLSATSAVATLPASNLQSNIRDRVWRSTSLATQTFSGTWGGDVRSVSAFGLWPGTGAASLIGAQVRVQLSCAGVSVYDSGTLDYYAFNGIGWGTFAWGATPWGCAAADRLPRLAPFLLYFSAVSADAFTITFTNAGAVDTAYFEAERIWLGAYVDAPYGAKPGAQPQWNSNSEQQRTLGGSLRRLNRARWREMQFETQFTTEADRGAWYDLTNLCDPANEIVLSLFPGEGSKRERDFTVKGSLKALNPIVFQDYSFHNLQLAVLES